MVKALLVRTVSYLMRRVSWLARSLRLERIKELEELFENAKRSISESSGKVFWPEIILC
jgi:uncharacterized membrane protein